MSNTNNTIRLFEDIATAISAKYIADVKAETVIQGERPSFDELMKYLREMEKELTSKAIKIIEQQKTKTSSAEKEMTEGFKGIIRTTIEGFIKQL